jgi:hypothetical protein
MNQYKCYLYSFNANDCAADKWDYGLLKETFDRNHIEQIKVLELPTVDRGFVVIPGPQNLGHEEHISNELSKISRVVLFITGDEEGRFDIEKIIHPNIEVWIQYPHAKHQKYNKLPIGVPQHLSQNLPPYPVKEYDLFFAGQITHQRRSQLAQTIQTIPNAVFKPTAGFAQGDKPLDYYRSLSRSRVAPAPSGAVVIDSFRFFEAIEMLCLPISDKIDPKGNYIEFYDYVFGEKIPVPSVSNWESIRTMLPSILKDYPKNMHNVVAWWIKYKRDLSIKIMRQINA